MPRSAPLDVREDESSPSFSSGSGARPLPFPGSPSPSLPAQPGAGHRPAGASATVLWCRGLHLAQLDVRGQGRDERPVCLPRQTWPPAGSQRLLPSRRTDRTSLTARRKGEAGFPVEREEAGRLLPGPSQEDRPWEAPGGLSGSHPPWPWPRPLPLSSRRHRDGGSHDGLPASRGRALLATQKPSCACCPRGSEMSGVPRPSCGAGLPCEDSSCQRHLPGPSRPRQRVHSIPSPVFPLLFAVTGL